MSEATLVYDDDCGFCTWWARRVAGDDVALVGFSGLTDETRERLPEEYEECAHLLADGEVYSCGAAIEEAVVRSREELRPVVDFLRQFGDYTELREDAYRAVAKRRDLLGQFVSADPPDDTRQ